MFPFSWTILTEKINVITKSGKILPRANNNLRFVVLQEKLPDTAVKQILNYLKYQDLVSLSLI